MPRVSYDTVAADIAPYLVDGNRQLRTTGGGPPRQIRGLRAKPWLIAASAEDGRPQACELTVPFTQVLLGSRHSSPRRKPLGDIARLSSEARRGRGVGELHLIVHRHRPIAWIIDGAKTASPIRTSVIVTAVIHPFIVAIHKRAPYCWRLFGLRSASQDRARRHNKEC